MSEDPKLFDAGDYNLFRYCHNDPIDFTDPMGLAPIEVPEDVDAVSRYGLDVLHREALSSGDGYERATSTGRENGKVFLSKEREIGKGTPYGKQKVSIPAPKPGSGKEPQSGLHVHRNDIQHDANDNQVQKGSLSTKADRNWADTVKKAIYTENESGNIKERYSPDDTKAGAGIIERWNNTHRQWEEIPLPKMP